ncbi:MAG: DUF116 domain-containing protein [bacterium]|nr:DUF116 domain-containing protein [bacterium]
MEEQTSQTVKGKSYSLYGDADTSDDYFRVIKTLADRWLKRFPDKLQAIRRLRRTTRWNKFIGDSVYPALSYYTEDVKKHLISILKGMSFSKMLDPVIRTRELMYHFHMLEIELRNQAFQKEFRGCSYKLALFPHCLKDFHPRCSAVPRENCEICKGCREDCGINVGTQQLEKLGVDSCIPIVTNLEKVLTEARGKHKSFGVLGIACVPELVRGMRRAAKLGIPAVGVPLDANSCARWMGEAKETTVNFKELASLLSPPKR